MEKTCNHESCQNPFYCKGFCRNHYAQFGKYGFTTDLKPKANWGEFCSYPNCDRSEWNSGLCSLHYNRRRTGRDMDAPIKWAEKGSTIYEGAICIFPECERQPRSKNLCGAHYAQMQRGKELKPQKRWKHDPSGWYKNSHGYLVRSEYDAGSSRRRKTVLQHRAVMEEHLGRALLGHENVHHLNGVRDDNRIENLELWSVMQPYGQRVEDKTAWAIEWLKFYEPELIR